MPLETKELAVGLDVDPLVESAAEDLEAAPTAAGSSRRLFTFALANIGRRPERTVLAVAGIALAISAAVVMRTIASGYQVLGVDAVDDAIGDAAYWAVPAGGVTVDPATGVIVAQAPPPEVAAPDGWTVQRVVVAPLPADDGVALVGRTDADPGVARLSPTALEALGATDGDPIGIAGRTLTVQGSEESGSRVTVALEVAEAAGATDGWLTFTVPEGDPGAPAAVEESTGLVVTSDPALQPAEGRPGLVYSVERSTDRLGFISFQQKFAALLGSQVSSSVLGLISNVALGLGFVIAVSTFVASVQERRREFGIMASIGLTDEVLYFFLVESLLLFVAAYVAGVLVGGAIVATAASSFFTLRAWLEAAGLVAMYLPALGIVAALIPVHRLLQQRPVSLLAVHE